MRKSREICHLSYRGRVGKSTVVKCQDSAQKTNTQAVTKSFQQKFRKDSPVAQALEQLVQTQPKQKRNRRQSWARDKFLASLQRVRACTRDKQKY